MAGDSGSAARNERLHEALKNLCYRGLSQPGEYDPELLALLGVPADSTVGEAHDLVRRSLFAYADHLEVGLRTVFLEAAGFRAESATSSPVRLQQAADLIGKARRTAYRWLDRAVAQIVGMATAEAERCVLPDIDYVFVRAHVRVDLAGSYPSVVTERTISARSAGIDHLDERLFFPRLTRPSLNLVALEGCAVDQKTEVERGIWAVRLRLPHPLSPGEQHTFSVSVRLPDHASLDPVIGFLPHTTSFDATIEFRFGDRLPAVIEQFLTPPPIPSVIRSTDATRVIPTGRRALVHLPQMRPGLCYGVRWQWAADGPEPSGTSTGAMPVS